MTTAEGKCRAYIEAFGGRVNPATAARANRRPGTPPLAGQNELPQVRPEVEIVPPTHEKADPISGAPVRHGRADPVRGDVLPAVAGELPARLRRGVGQGARLWHAGVPEPVGAAAAGAVVSLPLRRHRGGAGATGAAVELRVAHHPHRPRAGLAVARRWRGCRGRDGASPDAVQFHRALCQQEPACPAGEHCRR
jgi:hypothetical protein